MQLQERILLHHMSKYIIILFIILTNILFNIIDKTYFYQNTSLSMSENIIKKCNISYLAI